MFLLLVGLDPVAAHHVLPSASQKKAAAAKPRQVILLWDQVCLHVASPAGNRMSLETAIETSTLQDQIPAKSVDLFRVPR